MTHQHQKWLRELTSLPTAAGSEELVIEWVEAWVRRRRDLAIQRDRFGNLLVHRRTVRSTTPTILTAHVDHPAFVVNRLVDDQCIEAEFRGGVEDGYFLAGPPRVTLYHRDGTTTGRVEAFRPARGEGFKAVRIELNRPSPAAMGDVVCWDLRCPAVVDGRLLAPACDDLAGVAAVLSALDAVRRRRLKTKVDLRVLLTRAEEIGFLGATGACSSGLIPKRARLINVECSKSFAHSPIDGGPIIRVGDRTSSFDPELTYRLGEIAAAMAVRNEDFLYQRHLMPGGTCEASVFMSYGYATAALCLPLGNYHNMNEQSRQIDSEIISLGDYGILVDLLVEAAVRLGQKPKSTLKSRFDRLFAHRRHILD